MEVSPLRLDRGAILKAMKKRCRMELIKGTSGGLLERKESKGGGVGGRANSFVVEEVGGGRTLVAEEEEGNGGTSTSGPGRKKKRKKGKRVTATVGTQVVEGDVLSSMVEGLDPTCTTIRSGVSREDTDLEEGFGKDESSIFGQTQGSKNVTWVQCDKCKKVRAEDWIHIFFVVSLCPRLLILVASTRILVASHSGSG